MSFARALILVIFLFWPTVARAQLQSVIEKFEKGPHTGPVEEALVGLTVERVGQSGASEGTRIGNGIVLRCDGFILAPAAIFQDSSGQTLADVRVAVIIHPGRAKPTIVP